MTQQELEIKVKELEIIITELKKDNGFNKLDIKDIKRKPVSDLSNQVNSIKGSVSTDVTGTPNSGDATTDQIIKDLMSSLNNANDIITELKSYCNKLLENIKGQ